MIEGIYIITDEEIRPGRKHAEIARAALEGGSTVIQLRDKRASDEYLIEAGREIRRLTSEAGALFIVNDRLEVALVCNADGLHVGQGDRPASEIRALLRGKVLGVSILNPDQAAKARDDGADYLGVGPIFPTATKSDADPPTGLAMIEETKIASGGLPIVAIGGINEGNLAEVRRAGADSAAVISAIVCAPDMVEATRRLVCKWQNIL